MTIRREFLIAAVTLFGVACSDTSGPSTPPVAEATLDAQVRSTIGGWGVLPILPMRPGDPALVDLGRMLFFDKELSGNRDVSCATCHSPLTSAGDARSLAIGTGAIVANGVRQLGPGRQFTPRNAPSLFNAALGSFYMFWDGRVTEELGPGRFQAPAGVILPSGLATLLAAQAMIPVTNRVEMRGLAGDKDVSGNTNELATIA
ncbi:MAG TPA: cytochrome-c peroxidase, partial [Gemmatimonadaceae bacterium]